MRVLRIPPAYPAPFISRRHFLKIGAAGFAGLLAPAALLARKEELLRIRVFHTTDLHAHILPTRTYEGITNVGGFARVARQLRRWKARYPDHLLIDAGDLYQGTAVGHATEGEVMIRCLNHLGYDAWVAGNHEFDWGMDVFRRAVAGSEMPVLAANTMIGGRAPTPGAGAGEDYANLRPYVLKEVAGVRIGIVGLLTTGMFNWFPPELLKGFSVTDPVEATRVALRSLREEGADVTLLACHMGVRQGRHFDDHANHILALTREFPEIAAVIGAHTHQNLPSERVNGVPYTQASYHGIHLGRLELFFDPDTRRLVHVEPVTERMHAAIGEDAAVLALVGDDMAAVEAELDRPVGYLETALGVAKPAPHAASDYERFLGQALADRLALRGYPVDGVFHGVLFQDEPIPAGTMTVRDMWTFMPYENYVVLADLLPSELVDILEENFRANQNRSLLGFGYAVAGRGAGLRVGDLRLDNGFPLDPETRLTVAFNSYDSASGGNRLTRLREILSRPGSNRRLLPYQTRALLTEYFQDHERVRLRTPAAALY